MSSVNSTKNSTMTKNTKKLNRNMKRMKLKAASMCKTKTRVRWKEFQRSRLKSYRLQSTDSKKGKSADSSGIRAEDIKACDEETKEMVRQIFNEIFRQNEFTPGASRKVRKKWCTKKETWKMLETTARSVLCLRCTSCLRQYCTADYIPDLARSKRKIRRSSEALTKQQTI